MEDWESDFILCRSKILAMSSCYTIDTEKKLKYYLKSWSELGNIFVRKQILDIYIYFFFHF